MASSPLYFKHQRSIQHEIINSLCRPSKSAYCEIHMALDCAVYYAFPRLSAQTLSLKARQIGFHHQNSRSSFLRPTAVRLRKKHGSHAPSMSDEASRANTSTFLPQETTTFSTSGWCSVPSSRHIRQRTSQNAIAHTTEEPGFAQIPQEYVLVSRLRHGNTHLLQSANNYLPHLGQDERHGLPSLKTYLCTLLPMTDCQQGSSSTEPKALALMLQTLDESLIQPP